MLNIAICDDDIQITGKIERLLQDIAKRNFVDTEIEVFWNGKSLAAASIIAKVTRDRMMREYDKLFPEYDFAKNKGYGTAEHVAALKTFGPTPIHRRSFISNFI